MSKTTTILAIETSCDETGIAIVRKTGDQLVTLAQNLASQVDIHALTGGVVPEVAAREHVQALQPLIAKTLAEANLNPQELTAIAVTVGPGLMPALTTGLMAAKTLSYAWDKPLVPVHHIEGHIYSALLMQDSIKFPALALIVSGGHTLLINIPKHLTYEILGSTQDDAAGEAFDKVARLLGLPYPGGPNLSNVAEQGNSKAYDFPRPMLKTPDFNFSFSGLKTSVLYTWRDIPDDKKTHSQADVAASFQQAVVDVLVTKTRKAIEKYHPQSLLLAGGVAANKKLQNDLQKMASTHKVPLYQAPGALTGDNGVMIGQAACFAFEAGRTAPWANVDATARLPVTDFSLPLD
jgi:N6-L-threonylcarbamoyladenine synthase